MRNIIVEAIFKGLVAFGLLACAARAFGQDVPLDIKGGDVKVVKVVRTFPFVVEAPKNAALYFWTYPSGVKANDRGDNLLVEAAPKGELVVSVKIIDADWVNKKFLTKFGTTYLHIGSDPVPPDPGPKPPDPPTPDAAPYPSPGLTAMIVYETAEIGSGLSDVMSGAKTNDYMLSKGIKGGFLKLDKDVDVSGLPEWAKAAFTVPRKTLPWLVISNGKTGYSGEVPKDGGLYSPAKTLELLRKVGG